MRLAPDAVATVSNARNKATVMQLAKRISTWHGRCLSNAPTLLATNDGGRSGTVSGATTDPHRAKSTSKATNRTALQARAL